MLNGEAHKRAQAQNRQLQLTLMLDRVRELLQHGIGLEAGEKVVLAVSGGIDSMVLLDVFYRLAESLSIGLHVAHLDHRLRPEAAADGDFVEKISRERGLGFTRDQEEVYRFARQRGWSLEEAGRWLRYRFLDQVAQEQNSTKIALGHHAGDQAETVLLRLLRGSGTAGLGAMELAREGRYLRPLLGFQRTEIEAYAQAAWVEFREDISNWDPRFIRNRIRSELIPYLQQHYNPNIVQVLGRTAQILKDEDRFLNETVQGKLDAVVHKWDERKIILDVEQFLDYHIALQRRIIRTILQGLSKREGPFDFARIEAVLDLMSRDAGVHEIGSGLRAQRAGKFFFLYHGKAPPVVQNIQIPGVAKISSHGLLLRAQLFPVRAFSELKPRLGEALAAFDADLIGPHLQVRSPRPGDRFQPLGMEGHKKVSDFLIDLKWPRILRDEVLLLARGDEVVWIVGLRPSNRCRVSRDTRELALVELGQMD